MRAVGSRSTRCYHLNEVLSIRAQECETRVIGYDIDFNLNEVLSIRAQEFESAADDAAVRVTPQ